MPGREEVPERFEVTGNPQNGKPEMVPSPNPLGGGWVRYSDYEISAFRSFLDTLDPSGEQGDG